MKAAFIEEQGGPEVLKYGDVPDPAAGSNEVVVDIHAASVNGADWKVRSGKYGSITEFPYILGRDFSGDRPGASADLDGRQGAFGVIPRHIARFPAARLLV